MKVWIPHEEGQAIMGTMPTDMKVEVFPGDGEYPSDPAGVDFWVPPFLSRGASRNLLGDLTRLSVVQLLSAGVDTWAGVIGDDVTLCNATGVHTAATAEWALAAMLGSLRHFDDFARSQQRREWDQAVGTSLVNKKVLIIGAGDIGSAIARRVAACDAEPIMVARHERDNVYSVAELPELLPTADVVVLIVPLTDSTRGMVGPEFLAAMRPGALLVNAARGPVVDTAALVAATQAGRIRAAVDVTDPEPLPQDHPLWLTPGVLITPHVGGAVDGLLDRAYELVGDQLRRWHAGDPLRNVIRGDY